MILRFPLVPLLVALSLFAAACTAPPEPARATAVPAPTVDVEATVQARLQEERAKIPPTQTPQPQPLSEAGSAEKLLPSVVRVSTDTGMGSGVAIGDDLVVTNRHVVEEGNSVTVQARGSKEIKANVLAMNSMLDIALVKAPGLAAPAAAFADLSKMKAAEPVVAIGFPLDLKGDATVTRGLFSAVRVGEPLPGEWIQTDAAVNPGNSGGPLANLRGEVVGLTTMRKLSESSTPVEGINFALSANSIREVLPALMLAAGITPPEAQEMSTSQSAEIADFLRGYDNAEIETFAKSDDTVLKDLATPAFHSFVATLVKQQKARNMRRESKLVDFKLLGAYRLPGNLVVADVFERWNSKTYRNNRLVEDEGDTDQPQIAVLKRVGTSWQLAAVQFKEAADN